MKHTKSVPLGCPYHNTHLQAEENDMRIKTPNLHGLLWTLTIAALFAACQVSAEQATPAVDDKEINWLFVVSATGGSFDGKTLTLRDVPPVLIFSDRPDRVWGHMTVSELLCIPYQRKTGCQREFPNLHRPVGANPL